MRRGSFLVLGLAVLAVVGCETITEELPARPTQVVQLPTPVIVTPVPVPIPTAAPAPTPTPGSSPTPGPGPTPAPKPTPTPQPPPPGGGGGGSKVVRIGAKVFFLECDGHVVPDSEHATTAKMGCRVHLDATAKDQDNRPTDTKSGPSWHYSDPSMVKVGGKNPWTPVLTPLRTGTFTAYVVADNVRSNDVTFRIVN